MYILKRSGMEPHSFICKYTMPAFASYSFTR